MKSIVIQNGGGLDNLAVVERPEPSPKSGEILVRWHATSLNYHDYLVAIGAIPVPEGRIPMSDGAGEVVEVGDEVTEWQIGDHVMSLFFPGWTEGAPEFRKIVGVSGETMDGFMTQMSCLPQTAVTRVPEGFNFGEAATLPCAALTAWHAMQLAGSQPGQSVLVEGTGGVSIFALQFARAAGLRIYGTTSSAEKAKKLENMGCEAVVNYREDERWGKTIFKLSGGIDHVIDVGGGSTMKQSIEAAKIGGHITSIGILGDGRRGEITFPKLFFKFITMQGLAVGNRVMQQAMVRAIEINDIRPIISRSFAFEELADAFRYQEGGQHFGKIVVEW